MCGIAGLFAPAGGVADLEGVTMRMADAIRHRGPDGSGVWVDRSAGVGLGHRRLAIIDLSETGAQPMASVSGRFELTYNGEIYNYAALKRDVEAAWPQVPWRGHSDTEVLLAAIELWGLQAALRRADGMFALALWDRKDRVLHLARDRFGEKPLYYGYGAAGLFFASELSAIQAATPLGAADIDPDSVADLLQFAYVPAPHSIFRSIKKLPPASIVVFSIDDVNARAWPRALTFWDAAEVALQAAAEPFQGDDQALDRELGEHISRAVASRLIADVPVGAMLSGGVDSTVISALAQQQVPGRLRTFTVGFDDAAYDEDTVAAAVARHLGTEHTALRVTAAETLDIVPRLSSIYAEPFADSSQLPTFVVSRALRTHVTVGLSGDGGDELFAGYNRYRFGPRVWNRLSRAPLPLRAALEPLVNSNDYWAVHGLGRLRGVRGEAAGRWTKAARLLDASSLDDVYDRLVRNWNATPPVLLNREYARVAIGKDLSSLEPARRMMTRDVETYLPDDILTKVDRASMAVALECRPPFLTPDVFAFACALPLSRLIGPNGGKAPLRRLASRFVPAELMDRPKQGFAAPIDDWLRGPLRSWADDLLAADLLARGGHFKAGAVEALWRLHRSGQRDRGAQLWPILMFQSWLQELR